MADEQEQMRKTLGLDRPQTGGRSWAAVALIGAAAFLLGWYVYYQHSGPEEAAMPSLRWSGAGSM